MRDGSVMADSDQVDFLSGSTDSAINFSGSADLHTSIHPPQKGNFSLHGYALVIIKETQEVDPFSSINPSVEEK